MIYLLYIVNNCILLFFVVRTKMCVIYAMLDKIKFDRFAVYMERSSFLLRPLAWSLHRVAKKRHFEILYLISHTIGHALAAKFVHMFCDKMQNYILIAVDTIETCLVESFRILCQRWMHVCHQSTFRCLQFWTGCRPTRCAALNVVYICSGKTGFWYESGAGLWLAVALKSSHKKIATNFYCSGPKMRHAVPHCFSRESVLPNCIMYHLMVYLWYHYMIMSLFVKS
jgi:hypothetical protein